MKRKCNYYVTLALYIVWSDTDLDPGGAGRADKY